MRDLKTPDYPFGFAQPEESPGFLLWQTTTIWQRLIKKALEPYHVSHAQFVIMAVSLWFKKNHQDPTQSMIAELSQLDKMTVSKALKVLVENGLVHRVEHAQDTRAKSVQLTEKGTKLISKLIPIVEQVDDNFFGKAHMPQTQQLIRLLHALCAKAR